MATAHKFLPEKTNGGNYFSDCSCGASFGVYDTRKLAKAAHDAHKGGRPVPKPKQAYILFGPPIQGQGE